MDNHHEEDAAEPTARNDANHPAVDSSEESCLSGPADNDYFSEEAETGQKDWDNLIDLAQRWLTYYAEKGLSRQDPTSAFIAKDSGSPFAGRRSPWMKPVRYS